MAPHLLALLILSTPTLAAPLDSAHVVFSELSAAFSTISTLSATSALPLACAQLIPAAANFTALISTIRAGGDVRAVAAALAPPPSDGSTTPTSSPRALLSSARGPLDDVLGAIGAAAASLDARARAAAAELKALDVPLSGVAALARTIEERVGALLHAGLAEGGAALSACASGGSSGVGAAVVRAVRAATTDAAALVADVGKCDEAVDAFARALRQSAEEPLSGSARGSASAAGAERARCANSAASARATAAALTSAADALGVFTTALEKALRGFERAAVSRGGRALESIDVAALRGLFGGERGVAEGTDDSELDGVGDNDFLSDPTAEEEAALDSLGARWLADASACASRNGLTAAAAADALRVLAAAPGLAERAGTVLSAISGGLHATCASARDRDVGAELARALTALTRAAGRTVDMAGRAFTRVVDLSSSELPDSSRAGPPMPRFYRAIGPIADVVVNAFSGGAPVIGRFVRPRITVSDESTAAADADRRRSAEAAAEVETARAPEDWGVRDEEEAAAARERDRVRDAEAAAAEARRVASEKSTREDAERERQRAAAVAADAETAAERERQRAASAAADAETAAERERQRAAAAERAAEREKAEKAAVELAAERERVAIDAAETAAASERVRAADVAAEADAARESAASQAATPIADAPHADAAAADADTDADTRAAAALFSAAQASAVDL
jgi:hypothetical protein